jgi:uncharacterized protein (TIGR03083 family)
VLLTPRYDGPAALVLDGPTGDPAVPLLRQRRRLATTLAGLDAAQWAAPSRCDGWSVQDVVAHLVTTNQFWAFSASAALDGTPTRVLATFDPVASPAEMVAAVRSQSPAEVLARFAETNEALAHAVAGLDAEGWSAVGEAPPGHVSLRAVALHALWDAWVHERDIVLPLGLVPVEEADEIDGSLRYAAGLGPAFAATSGSTRTGTFGIEAVDPEVRLVVEVGGSVVVRDGEAARDRLRLVGTAVELLEALSLRAPLPHAVPEGDRWLLGSLGQVFDDPTGPSDRRPSAVGPG